MKSTSTNNQVVCHYCNQNGHMKFGCPIKRKVYYGVKCVWVPKTFPPKALSVILKALPNELLCWLV